MLRLFTPLAALALAGCPYVGEDGRSDIEDVDGDGFRADRFGGNDCDDTDASIGPCDADGDGVNGTLTGGNDCDDQDPSIQGPTAHYLDADGDGYGTGDPVLACIAPPETSPFDGDCDDGADGVNPGAPERCDAVDWNCDGDPGAGATREWFEDADGDGFGAPGSPVATTCDRPAGSVAPNPFDCDDTDPDAHPSDAITGLTDEICDGIDNDCDGLVDDEDDVQDPSAIERFDDLDGDGFGDPLSGRPTCVAGDRVTNSLDCDDTNPLARPGADLTTTEVCDGFDNDCDGLVDDQDPGVDLGSAVLGFPDADGDGFGDADAPLAPRCGIAVLDGTDCDDDDPTIHPGVPERCDDPADEDCDGLVNSNDPSNDGTITWYRDQDGDNIGATNDPAPVCDDDGRSGFSPVPGDCNDQDGSIFEPIAWFLDVDGDGFGNSEDSIESCFPQTGRVVASGDCNDDEASVNPSAIERCNFEDDDCNGVVDDDAIGAIFGFPDLDGDGYGADSDALQQFCSPDGVADNDDDCDDTNADVHPDQPEDCDAFDSDCDGLTGEQDPDTVLTLWYPDDDLDGFGASGVEPLAQCEPPLGYIDNGRDCDDTLAIIYFETYTGLEPNQAQPDGSFITSFTQAYVNPGRCVGDTDERRTTRVLVNDSAVFAVGGSLPIVDGDAFVIEGPAQGGGVLCWDPNAQLSVAGDLTLRDVEVVFGTPSPDFTVCVPASGNAVAPFRIDVDDGSSARLTLDQVTFASAELSGALIDVANTPADLARDATIELLRTSVTGTMDGLVDVRGHAVDLFVQQSTFSGTATGPLFSLASGTGEASTVTVDGLRVEPGSAIGGALLTTGTPADVAVERLTMPSPSSTVEGPLFCLDQPACALGASDSGTSTLELRTSSFDRVQRLDGSTTPLTVLSASEALLTEDLRVTSDGATDPWVTFQPPLVPSADDPGWTSRRDRFVGPTGGLSASDQVHRFESAHLAGDFPVVDPTGTALFRGSAVVDGELAIEVAEASLQALVVGSSLDVSATSTFGPLGGALSQVYTLPGATSPSACGALSCASLTDPLVSFDPNEPPARMIPYPRAGGDAAFAYTGIVWSADPNRDGLPVAWQMLHAADPACDTAGPSLFDPDGDPDGDDVLNLEEVELGTWPCIADTDGDGAIDSLDAAPLDAGTL